VGGVEECESVCLNGGECVSLSAYSLECMWELVFVCVCVREREKNRKRERERGA
jgi:hypothetical protein